jgi:hypothetical protein
MRRAIAIRLGLLAVLAAAALPSFSQAIVGNPAKPKAPNAGRVVTPTEVLAISDEGRSDYYFQWPRDLRPGPEGSLLLTDRDQVLHFDKDGRFLQNLFKKGQGPGEMSFAGTAVATEKNIVIYSASPSKLVYFDRTGRYEKEIAVRVEGRRDMRLIGHQSGSFSFDSGGFPRTTGDPDIVDNPRTILAVDAADGSIRPRATFVTRAWVVTSAGGAGGMFALTSLVAAPFQDRFLALTHTEDYLIELFDTEADKVVREFRRPYPRIKGEPLTEAEKKGGLIIDGKHYTRPERKYENDIKNLLTRDGEIWAVTSTKDKAKGVLIDVFDGEGAYRDAFYLDLPEAAQRSLLSPGQCALDGEFLWIVERAEDETFAIKKYRLFPSSPKEPTFSGDGPWPFHKTPCAWREDKEDDMSSSPRSRS